VWSSARCCILGETNASQREAWRNTIELNDEGNEQGQASDVKRRPGRPKREVPASHSG